MTLMNMNEGWVSEWINAKNMNEWINRWMDGCIQWMNEWMIELFNKLMNQCCYKNNTFPGITEI